MTDDPQNEVSSPVGIEPAVSSPAPTSAVLSGDPDALLARYGADLTDGALSDEQARVILTTLWNIMRVFVDLGYSLKAGDNSGEGPRISFEDVLDYLQTNTAALEADAAKKNDT